jgi:hypothetical protein
MTKWTDEEKQKLIDLMQSNTPLARARARFYQHMAKIEQQSEQGLNIFDIRVLEFEAARDIAKVFGIDFMEDGSIKQTVYER